MKMKKLFLVAVITMVAMSLKAQPLMVESAFQDMNKGSLKKAQTEIDAASVHDKTKGDPKTWYYRAFIYAKIGEDASKPKPKYKDLAPDWADQAYEAVLECKRLDTEKEFSAKMKSVYGIVGIEYFNRSGNLFNEKNYGEAMQTAAKAAEMFTNANTPEDAENANSAMYRAGLCAMANHDTANVKKYLNNVTRRGTKNSDAYSMLFNVYKAEKDVEKAMTVARNYIKRSPNDYRAYILAAEGYLLGENVDKGKEMINKALELTKDSVNIYPTLLAQSAALLEVTGDYEGAEAKFNESLTLNPNQFDANYNMGRMFYNRAVDKIQASPEPDPFDEDKMALYNKILEEAQALYAQSLTFFEKAVAYVDGLPEGKDKVNQTPNLINGLNSLAEAYARLDRLNEATAARKRAEQLTNEWNAHLNNH